MELALPLLPLIAPDVAPPIAYRDGRRAAPFRPRRARPPRRRRGARGRPGGAPRRANGPDRSGRDPRRDRAAPASPRDGVRRALVADPGADAARGEGARVRPRRAGRAGGDRGRRSRGPACALRRPHARDEDARRGARGAAAAGAPVRLSRRDRLSLSPTIVPAPPEAGVRLGPDPSRRAGYQRERRPRRPE